LITAAIAATQRTMTNGLPADLELRRDTAPVPYRTALEEMSARNAAIAAGQANELLWLLDHSPVYTAGTSAAKAELLDPRFDVVEAGRGGRYTYHGPGQRVGYVLLDLRKRARDARGFVHALEGWVIDALEDFGVESWRAEGRIGIWTRDIDGREAKIGAIGVRIRRWVTMHGIAVNLSPDLSHFAGIVPCGIEEFGVTSLRRLGIEVDQAAWDRALLSHAGEFLAALDRPRPEKIA
jgi:lipoyl(octanoyl) transferase